LSLDVRALVEADRVHRLVYTDPEIFALEIERIFARAWIYVGHVSQTPNPGDFITTTVARRPVVMIRQDDGGIQVLRNRCGHRGAMVVTQRCGHAQMLRCAYHGWTYHRDGTLNQIPLADGYEGTSFDRCDPAQSMPALPRVASYRGFVFASLAADGPDLESFLGPARAALDNMIERAPDGAIEVAGGSYRTVQRNNWKIYLENLHDGLHPMIVHQASVDASREVAKARGGPAPLPVEIVAANGQNYRQMGELQVACHQYGHSDMRGFRRTRSDDPEYLAALERRLGPAGAEAVLADSRHNAMFYPSMSVHPAWLQLRVIQPEAVDRARVEIWCFRLKGAPPSMLRRTVTFANTVHSPASIIKADDLEAYERVQNGLSGDQPEWVSLHRRRGTDPAVSNALDEHFIRNQYRAWLDYMDRAA
jgi:phenylpropionate dioxygenase-like ring-hydroxylating dioxygenase large terminal subunit